MKILFLSDNFPPEVNAPASRTYDHCKSWVELGIDVTVITCFPNFPQGKIHEGYKNKLYEKEVIDGIEVIRVWSYMTANTGFFKRTIDFISYATSSFICGLFIKSDVIIATSPQLFTAISGKLLSFFKRSPYIMEVRDLWPDSIVAVGSMSQKSILYSFLKKIEFILYKSSSKIIVLTESFKNYLEERNIPESKIGVFKNGVFSQNINLNFDEIEKIKKDYDLIGKVVVSYVGTFGLAHNLEFILECIASLQNDNIKFLFIGDGAKREQLIKIKNEKNLHNVIFINTVPKSEVSNFISVSDYALVNLKKSNDFKKVIPSKIFENVALKKPILLGVDGESKDLIEYYGVGVSFEPENKMSFFDALRKIEDLKSNQHFVSNCERFIKDFDRKKIAEKALAFISK